jgi:hypothetical protein
VNDCGLTDDDSTSTIDQMTADCVTADCGS